MLTAILHACTIANMFFAAYEKLVAKDSSSAAYYMAFAALLYLFVLEREAIERRGR